MPSILHKYILQNFLIFWNDSAAHYLLSHIRFCRKNLTATEKLLSYVSSFRKNTVKASEGSGSGAD